MDKGNTSINWRDLAEAILTAALADAKPPGWELYVDINAISQRSSVGVHLHMYKLMPPTAMATPAFHFIEEMSFAQCQAGRVSCAAEVAAAIGRLKQRIAAADLAGAERESESLVLEFRNRQGVGGE